MTCVLITPFLNPKIYVGYPCCYAYLCRYRKSRVTQVTKSDLTQEEILSHSFSVGIFNYGKTNLG